MSSTPPFTTTPTTPLHINFRYTYTAMRISIPRPSIFLRLLSTPHNKPVLSCHIYPLNLTYFHFFPFRPGYVVHSSVPLPLGKWDNRVTSSFSYFAAVASCRRRTGWRKQKVGAVIQHGRRWCWCGQVNGRAIFYSPTRMHTNLLMC